MTSPVFAPLNKYIELGNLNAVVIEDSSVGGHLEAIGDEGLLHECHESL